MEHICITRENMSELVNNAFLNCLFKENEDTSDCVFVQGIARNFGFHPKLLEEQRELIIAILAELPSEFKEGYTFLNLCNNKDGKLWTGEHETCEQLVCMAIGLGLMHYCLPRPLWSMFPCGLPYLIVK